MRVFYRCGQKDARKLLMEIRHLGLTNAMLLSDTSMQKVVSDRRNDSYNMARPQALREYEQGFLSVIDMKVKTYSWWKFWSFLLTYNQPF